LRTADDAGNVLVNVGEKLTSRALKEDCIFTYGYLVQSEIRTVGGKQKRFQKKTPLSYVLAPQADNQGNG
jgi:hypothetical protein